MLASGWVLETWPSSGFKLTSQNGIQLCHHLPSIVQAEAHWGFKLQDVPPRAISAQQNVVLLQPVRTGHPFTWPSRPSSAWPWPHVQCSSHTAFRAFHGPVPARTLLVTPTKVLCIWPTAAPAWGALHLVLSLLPPRTGALPHLTPGATVQAKNEWPQGNSRLPQESLHSLVFCVVDVMYIVFLYRECPTLQLV